MWPTGNFVTVYFYKYIPADLFVAPLKSICMSPCSVRPALRLASCSTFSEKCLETESRGGGRWRRKRRLRPKQFSMSYYVLRLLADLIHNCTPPSIINEQVQCHIAQEPVLPISNTTAVALACVPGSSTTTEPSYHPSQLLALINPLQSTRSHHSLKPWVEEAFRCA